MRFDAGIRHRRWQLILIPSLSLFASLIVLYSNPHRSAFPWRTFFSIAGFTYIIWEVNLIVYRILDHRMAFYEQPGKRLAAQIVFCFLATWITFTLLYFLMSFMQSGIVKNIFGPEYVFFCLLSVGISLAVNALYVIRYLQSTVLYKEALSTQMINELLRELEDRPAEGANADRPIADISLPSLSNTDSIMIESANKTFPIAFEEMSYWFSGNKIVILVLKDGRKITTNFSSFTPVLNKLPATLFFQLNRQFVVHIKSIASVQDEENGKLSVELQTLNSASKKEIVNVSRYKSREFKTWFAQSVGLTQH